MKKQMFEYTIHFTRTGNNFAEKAKITAKNSLDCRRKAEIEFNFKYFNRGLKMPYFYILTVE